MPSPVDGQIASIVRLAQQHLGMDVTYVSQFRRGRQVYTALAGDAASFGMRLGDGPPLEDTYCARLVAGELPGVIPDSTADARVAGLATTRDGPIGAYVGVPLHLPDGTLYGTFCCLSHDRQPQLDERDVALLAMLSQFLQPELAAHVRTQGDQDAVSDVLRREAVSLALQPVVDLQSGRVSMLEALARFPSSLGPPGPAFAAAARAGLRAELEQLPLRHVLDLLVALPEAVLTVNLSPDVACWFGGTDTKDVPLDRLVLELTEHDQVESYTQVRDLLQPLRDRGLRLAIDDTGAGFSSLRHVVELNPDILKVDRSLVAGLQADRARRSVVTTFVLLALDIGATVIAEGVETFDELRTVASLGVDAVQGYLLARPSTDPHAWARWVDGTRLVPGTLTGLRPETSPLPGPRPGRG